MATEAQRKWIRALSVSQGGPPAAAEPSLPRQHSTNGPARNKEVKDAERPEATRPGSKLQLSGSVGAGGRNAKDDVRAVQAALNREAQAGLAEDGVCGKKTIEAIIAFQKKLNFKKPDGRIDQGGPTEKALNGSASAPLDSDNAAADTKGGVLIETPGRKKSVADPQGPKDDAAQDRGPDPSRIARRIHEAVEGVGTDEQAIFAALRELKGSRELRVQLGKIYKEMFGDDLEEVLRSELSEDDRARADAAANQKGGPDFKALAQQIHDAAEGAGTDEKAINAALSQVKGKPDAMKKLRETYRTMYGEDLDEVLRQELSGRELKNARENLDPNLEVIPDKGFDEVGEERVPRQGFEEAPEEKVPRKGFKEAPQEKVPRKGFDEVEEKIPRKGFVEGEESIPRKGFKETAEVIDSEGDEE